MHEVLEAGDCAYMESEMALAWSAAGKHRCRVLAVLLNPFLPGTSAKIYAQLGLPGTPDKLADATWGGLAAGHMIGEPAPLFPRKDV